jgi:hypothetical protein
MRCSLCTQHCTAVSRQRRRISVETQAAVNNRSYSGLRTALQNFTSTANPRTRLVAQTGWGREQDRRRTHDARFDHYIVEIDPQTLVALLQTGEARY